MRRKALVVGVNQYQAPIVRPEQSLKDAEAIGRFLQTLGHFDDVQIVLNRVEQNDQQSSGDQKRYEPEELRNLIHEFFNPGNGEIADTALFFFSGNGAGIYGAQGPETQIGDLLLTDFPGPVTQAPAVPFSKLSSTDFSASPQPETPETRSISLEWLYQQLETSPIKQQIVWLDSDFSQRFIELSTQLGSCSTCDRCLIAAKPNAAGYAGESTAHGILTEALLQALNPAKQIKNSITNYTLQDILTQEFDWPANCLSNTGNPIFLRTTGIRAQKLWNDLAAGEDWLNIKAEAEALADMLLLRELEPPLAVGILGGWGSGKSFIMQLMQKRMNQIRSVALNAKQTWGKAEEAFPYVGHVYQIKFDAWTYAKGDLWYSLAQTIFCEFNRQYTLEKQLEDALQKAHYSSLQGGKLWQVLNDMSDRDRTLLLKEITQTELPSKVYEELEKSQSSPELINHLWETIKTQHSNEQQKLDDLNRTFQKNKQELRWLLVKKSILYFLRKNWLSLLAFLIGCSIVTFPFWSSKLKEQLPKNLYAILSANQLITLLTGASAAWVTGRDVWQKTRKEQEMLLTALQQGTRGVEAIKDTAVASQTAILRSDEEVREKVKQIKQQETQLAQWQQHMGWASQYPSLTNLLEDLARKDDAYEQKLGYLHQLQRHLTELTESFYCQPATSQLDEEKFNQIKTSFPRGPARIVLFIDDLDRCPPDRVVEVLEAVQLLVRTPLFIAVLAIDERYVTRALEKHYAGVLFHQGQPSGTDYLEKIIQIPYRVRPIAHSALPNYLHQQMELETPDTATPQEIAAASTPSDNNQPSRFLPDTAVESVQEQSANPAAERNEDEQENFLTTETIKFSNEEFQQLLNCCQQTDLSPRMIKRLVNVYKIFKIIEVLSNKVSPKNTQRSQEPILAVLALSARYPDLIRDVLADVTIQFEQIMRENHPQNLRNVKLLELLPAILNSKS